MPVMLSKVLELLDYYSNVLEPFRPVASFFAKKILFGAVIKDLDELDRLPSPRIIKSQRPFYLLPPDVLEKSNFFLLYNALLLIRLCTLHVTLKTSKTSFLYTTISTK